MHPKLKLHFADRLGIVANIAVILAENDFNIFPMEVVRIDSSAYIYIEAEKRDDSSEQADIFELLGRIPDLAEISMIRTLPGEERENRFRVVLDNISDGVISVGNDGKITTINKVAKRILDCENSEVIGSELKDLKFPSEIITECLRGKKFSNVKKTFINDRGRFQFFATGRPIKDSSGRIVGAVEIGKDMREIKILAEEVSRHDHITFSDFMGDSPPVREALSFAQKIAGTGSVVSIRGESGTGKELLARAIHSESGRNGLFIPINCAALPESLLESELFGYTGGAFTGAAKQGKAGLFEAAESGTVFLDEIGEMPPGSQSKILRLIQERKVRRIGGSREIPVNARIITATNKNLEQMINEKLFREDLYYRINVLPIHIPPLRERGEKEIIGKTLKKHESIRKAAKALGVSHTTLMNKLKKHKMKAGPAVSA